MVRNRLRRDDQPCGREARGAVGWRGTVLRLRSRDHWSFRFGLWDVGCCAGCGAGEEERIPAFIMTWTVVRLTVFLKPARWSATWRGRFGDGGELPAQLITAVVV